MKLAKAVFPMPFAGYSPNGVYDIAGWVLADRFLAQRKLRLLDEKETAEFIKGKTPEEIEALKLVKDDAPAKDDGEMIKKETVENDLTAEKPEKIHEVFKEKENPEEKIAIDPEEVESEPTNAVAEKRREKEAEEVAETVTEKPVAKKSPAKKTGKK